MSPPQPVFQRVDDMTAPGDILQRGSTAIPASPHEAELRDAFAALAATVAVVTTNGPTGPVGMTASTVCSLSLRPALLLVCADNGCRTLPAIRSSQRFAVNALTDHHTATADIFARPEPAPGHRFGNVAHHDVDGLPVLTGALATFVCSLEQTHPGGDHTILVGRIHSVKVHSGKPLVWQARSFHYLVSGHTDPSAR